MRLFVIVLALAAAAHAPLRADPTAASGWRIDTLDAGLEAPSGLARDGDTLVVSDLASGRIVRIGADGAIAVVHSGLPVGRDVLGERTGPYKVQVRAGRVFVAQGWQDVTRDEVAIDHAILELTGDSGARTLSNRFWNPYDFEWGGDAWYVADAAQNALWRLGPDGVQTLVFRFPDIVQRRRDLGFLSPTEFNDDEAYEVEAVPTGVAIGGGRVFVALFGGFPFLAGGGRVVSLALTGGGDARLELDGLDAPIDVAFDAMGRLLVVEMGRFELASATFRPATGRLSRVDLASGDREILIEGLSRPVTVVSLARGSSVVVQSDGTILRLRAGRERGGAAAPE